MERTNARVLISKKLPTVMMVSNMAEYLSLIARLSALNTKSLFGNESEHYLKSTLTD